MPWRRALPSSKGRQHVITLSAVVGAARVSLEGREPKGEKRVVGEEAVDLPDHLAAVGRVARNGLVPESYPDRRPEGRVDRGGLEDRRCPGVRSHGHPNGPVQVFHRPAVLHRSVEREAEIDALGEVRHIAAPNKLHHLFAGAAKERWPSATLLGASGLASKRPDLALDGELEGADLGDDISLYPIRGIPLMNEVVLFHAPSRSLVVSDLVFHMHDAPNAMTWFVLRFLAGTLGRLGQSRMVRWSTKDREAYEASVREVLGLGFERLVVGHGDVIDGDAAVALAEALLPGEPKLLSPSPTT